ncbi:MAG: hypothetical protein NTZ98_09930 [Acidobacteria bacterium]|nr:hypothetical protein [Acidobacteriota bacterium]
MNIQKFINDLRRRRELLDEAIFAAERLAAEGRRGRPPGRPPGRRAPGRPPAAKRASLRGPRPERPPAAA